MSRAKKAAKAQPATDASSVLNTGILSEHADNIEKLTRHRKFVEIKDSSPLDVAKGGVVAPFSQANFKKAMAHDGVYVCGLNLFHLNLKHICVPGVPIRRPAVMKMVDTRFKDPVRLGNIVIPCVPSDDVMSMFGALESITPEEDFIAYVQAMVRDVVETPVGNKTESWVKMCMTTVVEFRNIELAKRLEAAVKLRDEVAGRFLAVGRTSFQRLFEIMRYWSTIEGTDAQKTKQTVKFYTIDNNLAETGLSDKVSQTFIESCVSVHSRAFSNPVVLNCVAAADSELDFKSPFDSVFKMKAIVGKTKGVAADMEWAFTSISDSISQGHYPPPPMGAYRNELSGCSGKSLVDLILLQRDFKDFILGGADGCMPLSDETTQLFKKLALRPDIFRKECGLGVMQPWRAELKTSEVNILKLIEDVTFSGARHAQLNTVLTSGMGPSHILKTAPVSDAYARIKDMMATEHDAAQTLVVAENDDQQKEVSDDDTHQSSFQYIDANPNMEQDLIQILKDAERHAQQSVNTWISLVVDEQIDDVVATLSDHPVVRLRGDVSEQCGRVKYFGVVYEQLACGEPLTSPASRFPSMRDGGEHMQTRINMIMNLRNDSTDSDTPVIHDGDAYFIFAGRGHADLSKGLLKPFSQVAHKETRLWAHYDENALRARKLRARGVGTIRQVEQLVIVTSESLFLNEAARACYPGTTCGEMIGPVVVPQQQWMMTVQKKRSLRPCAVWRS